MASEDFILSNDDGSSIILESITEQDFIIDGGEQGPPGPKGSPGQGLIAGGDDGDFLVKDGSNASANDFKLKWKKLIANGTTKTIVQTGHGFVVGNPIRISGLSAYAKSQADSVTHADVTGIVIAVADADNFTILTEGYLSGLSGLTPGQYYFLDWAVAGNLVAVEPTTSGQVRKPLFVADTPTSGFFHNYEGIVITGTGSGTGGGAGATTLTGDITGSGTGTIATLLAAIGTAGTYGDGTHVPQITLDSKGRVTGVTLVAITGGGGGGGTAGATRVANVSGTIDSADANGWVIARTAGITLTLPSDPTTVTQAPYTVNNDSSDVVNVAGPFQSNGTNFATWPLYPGNTITLLPVSSKFIII